MYKDLDTSFLIDVIGIITGASGEQEFEKDGTKQKRITVELDQDGVRVECAFFGKYVSEVSGYLSSVDATNDVVVVQCCKIKPFKGIMYGKYVCKIHASVRKTLIYRFQSLLSEGRVYQISFFGVGEKGRDFRPTSHPFKINFDIHTSVRLVPNKAINLSPYNFVPISDIMFKDLDTSFLIDVIGILTGASAEQEFEKDGGKHKRITIALDQDGARVECAFFGKYVDEVVGYLGFVDATNVVVVHLIYLKLSFPLMASRIDDLTKIDASKETWTIFAKFNRLWLSSSLYGSKLPSSMDMILMDDKGCKIHATVRKALIYRFKSLLTEGRVYQISFFGVGESGRDFRPTSHPFKINFDIHTSVRLVPNKTINLTPYKLCVSVTDDTGSAQFMIFDREVFAIIQKSFKDVEANFVKGGDKLSIPQEICNIMHKQFLFKVEAKEDSGGRFESTYTVNFFCKDSNIIMKFIHNVSSTTQGLTI
ncbi:uncharacterized protein LOC130738282 [Lotus japonicus]|uniref:uncharacterized protein LOC130738282 n=1 Tax=Lotus japonicus TaxID=34305 RepID=UPI0025838779|nr:uncharacterized protein LOC130738282 [Lotus japonicus]